MSDNEEGGEEESGNQWTWSISDQPFGYVIFPLLILIITCIGGAMLYRRRRRRRIAALNPGQSNPDRSRSHIGYVHNRGDGGNNNNNSRRWAPWGATRSQEGLNELGEAPPPYDGKRDTNVQETELRDLESGMAQPPGYPAQPGPAITTDRRWA